MARTIRIEISPGELIDKLTILEIKLEQISDPAKLGNIRREYDMAKQAARETVAESRELAQLTAELKASNRTLWQIEDDLRAHERSGDFGAEFVKLARSVYRTNDRRAALKRSINALLGSGLVEEKSYSDY
jgi:hypothetical protein